MMFSKSLCRIAACLLLLMAQAAFAQECDPSLQPSADKSVQYRPRKGRCEGLYESFAKARGVSGLEVVGLTVGAFQFELDKKEVIEISSPIVTDEPVNVRSVGIPLKTYFRLDAQLEPGQTLKWPVGDVLLPARLYAAQIGVYGWLGNNREEVYVPVSAVGQSIGASNDRAIRLVLRASDDVERVQWRYAEAVDGSCEALPSAYLKLPQASYFSGQPIIIDVPSSGSRELCVDVAASSPSGWLKRLVRVRVGR